jgi:hypothetical protein
MDTGQKLKNSHYKIVNTTTEKGLSDQTIESIRRTNHTHTQFGNVLMNFGIQGA